MNQLKGFVTKKELIVLLLMKHIHVISLSGCFEKSKDDIFLITVSFDDTITDSVMRSVSHIMNTLINERKEKC
jgi:hypothetical protein